MRNLLGIGANPYTSFMKSSRRTRHRNVVNIFGFPTTVKPGFGIFTILLAILYPFPLGVWVAGTVAIFTVIHELGHALAARQAGCRAAIALDFMVAYASYEPVKPLTWGQRARIAFAGPSLQIITATALLLGLGVNPFSKTDISSSDATAAIWWAGIALGVVNLVPLLPLDGGAIVSSIVDRFTNGRGREIMLPISFVLTAISFVSCLIFSIQGVAPLLALLMFIQYQTMSAQRRAQLFINDTDVVSKGDPLFDSLIIDTLLNSGEYSRARDYAISAYRSCPAFNNAFSVAKASASLHEDEEAVAWLHTAENSQLANGEFLDAFESTPVFDRLRDRADVSAEWFANR